VTGSGSVGGLVGFHKQGTLSESFAVGNVTGAGRVGGLVGQLGGTNLDPGEEAIVRDSYFDNQTTGQSAAVGNISAGNGTAETRGEVTGLTTSQMQGESAATTMSTLDFQTTWTTVTSPDDYPVLRALPSPPATEIEDWHDLDSIRSNLSGQHELTANLNKSTQGWDEHVGDPSDGWTPIGNATEPFSGMFNGNGHTIEDLIVSDPEVPNAGLFAVSGGTVENVVINDSTLSGQTRVGALAGVNEGTINNVSVLGGGPAPLATNVSKESTNGAALNAATIQTTSESDAHGGGIVGVNEGTIIDSNATGILHQPASGDGTGFYGGVVGTNSGLVQNSAGDATSSVGGRETVHFGGVSGVNTDTGIIDETQAQANLAGAVGVSQQVFNAGGIAGTNEGEISASQTTGKFRQTISADINIIIGGLAGDNSGTVTNSHTDTEVYAGDTSVRAGGAIGFNRGGTVKRSYATGPVTAKGESNTEETYTAVGGFIGSNSGDVTESYATGSVTGDSDTNSAGGLIGSNSGDVTESYATGSVTGDSDEFVDEVGGLVGLNSPLGTITESYATGSAVGEPDIDRIGTFAGENVGDINQSYVRIPAGPGPSPVGREGEIGVLNITELMGGEMTQPGAQNKMDEFDFEDTWETRGESLYPKLRVIPEEPNSIRIDPYVPTPSRNTSFRTKFKSIDIKQYHWYLNGELITSTSEPALEYEFDETDASEQHKISVEHQIGEPASERSAESLPIGALGPVENRSFEVAPSVFGTVTDDAGTPVGDAEVEVYDAADPFDAVAIRNATTTSDGTYSIASIPVLLSGQVQLVVEPPNESALTRATSDPFESAGVDRVGVELGEPIEQLRDELEETESESRDLIDQHTAETAGVYVDGYQTFDEGGDLYKPSFELTDTADLLDATSEALKDSPSRKDIALSLGGFFTSLATGPSDHPLVDYHVDRYSNAPQLRESQLERVSELADAEWFEENNYAESPNQAYEEGFTKTAVYEDAVDRLNNSSDQFDNLTEMNVSEIPDTFGENIDEVEYILERQLDDLVGDQSYVITPNGSGVRFNESTLERVNYERAVEKAESASNIGDALGFIGLVVSGATLLLVAVGTGGTALFALGLASTAIGIGETMATVRKIGASNRAVMHWKDSMAFWAADLEEIPRIHRDNVNWLADQVEDPTLHNVEGTIENTTVRAQSYDDPSDDDPEKIEQLNPQPVLLCHSGPTLGSRWNNRVHEVTVTNTGETTATVHVVTEVTRHRMHGNEVVDISESVSNTTDPVTLAPGETRTIESSFTAYKKNAPTSVYNWYVKSTVLMDGKIVAQQDDFINKKGRGLREDFRECQGYNTDVAVADETAKPYDAFQDHRANTTILAETDLTPDERSIEQTVEMANDTKRVTISLGQQPRSNVTLAVVGPDGNITGVTQSGAALSSVEQIPNSTYSGPRDGIEGEEFVIIESPPENLTVRAEGRWFLSYGSFSTQVRMTEVPERPALVDVRMASIPGMQLPARVGDTTERPVEITELGNQSGADISLTVSESGLPDDIDVTLNETATSLAPGANDTVGLQIETAAGVDPGVYSLTMQATGSGAQTSGLELPVVTVDETTNLSVKSLRRVTDGLQFESVGDAVGTPPAGYQVARGYDIQGNTTGEVDLLVEDIETDNRSVPFVRSDGEWESLARTSSPDTIRRTVPADADVLAVLEPVVDQPAFGTVSGTVTDTNGIAATGVEIRFIEQTNDTLLDTVVVDEDGKYELALPADTYDIVIDDESLGTFEGEISVERAVETTLDIELGSAPAPLPGFDNPPTDPNGDRLYEDIDGDGTFDIFDVQALFNGLESNVVQNNPEAFNFNEDDNPTEVTIFDIQGLFDRL
jgi:hypothetical protein